MSAISIDTAVLVALAAAALTLVIALVRAVGWLLGYGRGSTESRLIAAYRATESWSTPLALAPILQGRRDARERDY